ncbi:MAG: hypothetical protein HQ519_01725 [Planctomycetes bacterium]|nr:hypothetical protein [Planctomycetota bacterium]
MNTRPLLIIAIAALTSTLMALPIALSPPQEPQEKVEKPKKEVPAFIGSIACRKCHGDQYKTWKKTKMADAFTLLKAGERAEAKVKAGLDPKKDYTKDETCLPCHVTGYGEPGGYAIPPKGDTPEAKKAQKAASEMEGIQCESCHGPASLSVAHKKTNEKYLWEDIVKQELLSGMRYPDKETCAKCHNNESPFVAKDYIFDFEKRKVEGTHLHYKMDFDHGCSHKHSVSKKKKKGKKS